MLTGEVAVIIGTCSEISRATGLLLGRKHVRVLIEEISHSGDTEAVSVISRNSAECEFIRVHVGRTEEAHAMLDACFARPCELDIVMNNVAAHVVTESRCPPGYKVSEVIR